MDAYTALTLLVCVIILSLAFRYIDLQIKINQFLDVHLKADKQESEESRLSEGEEKMEAQLEKSPE